MVSSVVGFVRDEPVLTIAAVAAVLSFLAAGPDSDPLGNIDVRTLCILFCLMAAVAGLRQCGAFGTLAHAVVRERGTVRGMCAALVFLPFVCSMAITNDVALIVFVPMAVFVLERAGERMLIVPVLVLQTLAANLGSTLTPFGNPQNLFIHSFYGLGAADLTLVMLPVVLVGTVLLSAMTVATGNSKRCECAFGTGHSHGHFLMAVSGAVFITGILSVFGIVSYWVAAGSALAVFALVRPRVLREVDYGLLATFVALFVLTGNLASSPQVASFLEGLMGSQPMLASVCASQFISNVPAAVMLSGFTGDWQALLLGVNIGGFGTPIASMASVITLRFYLRTEGHDGARFMKVFALGNVAMLSVLLALAMFLS